ncbi:MAG TPA: NADH oxidase [Clostridiaceae bacterium]|nr:NADH oxidase [Clostridiaceae bacterium]
MSYLLKPLEVGTLSLSNRLVMPPMATSKAKADGTVSRPLLDYYKEKSEGGYISLIIIEHSYIDLAGKASFNQLSISDDKDIAGLHELADVVHKNGCKVIMQINHAGSLTSKEVTGTAPLGPFSIVNPRKGNILPHALSAKEIRYIIEDFAKAAVRVKKAGFDGVEVHSAHGYLLNQFLSPLTNKREDEYGGDIYKRILIHLQIIKSLREAVGDGFPLFVRLGASDFRTGGTNIEDSTIAAREFERAGADAIDISGGLSGYEVPGLTGQGYFAPLSEAVKKAVSIPVILTGGITKADAAEKLIRDGKADLVGVGRAMLKHSSWAKEAILSLKD